VTRALITGASGFVGRHLAAELDAHGTFEIIGISSRPRPPLDHGRLIVCDLLDADLTRRVLERYRPDTIFHLAGQAYVPRAVIDPAGTLITNAVSQINVLEACRAVGLDPVVVVAGSAEIYGMASPTDMPLTEDQPFRPSNPYAVSKLAQDMFGLQYALSYGMRIVRARPFNHVGPGQSDRFVLSNFARQIAEAEAGLADPVLLVGNLDARRDFLDVRDVVRAYRLLADARFAGEAFNIASGIGRSIRDLLGLLLSRSAVDIEVRSDPARMRPSDLPVLIGDASRLRDATGWTPEIPIEQSIADTLDDWRGRVRRNWET
jgi:GDP-4-dehydro-6-deoxy-D-mannose reductase